MGKKEGQEREGEIKRVPRAYTHARAAAPAPVPEGAQGVEGITEPGKTAERGEYCCKIASETTFSAE